MSALSAEKSGGAPTSKAPLVAKSKRFIPEKTCACSRPEKTGNMQTISIALYLAFVAVALVFARRQERETSIGLWIPQIWLLIAASRPVVDWIAPDAAMRVHVDDLSGSPIDRAVFSVLLILGIGVLLTRRADWRAIFRRNFWLLTLCGYVGLTTLWSDFEFVSFKRWVRAIGDLVMALVVLTEKNPHLAIRLLIARCAILLLPLSIIFIKFFPHLGLEYTADGEKTMWIGVTTHKNELGALALMCGIVLVSSLQDFWRRRDIIKWIELMLLVMVGWVLRGSSTADSKTSVLLFAASASALILLNLFRPGPGRMKKVALLLCLVYLILDFGFGALTDSSLYDGISYLLGRDPTLTGRTDLWKELLARANQNPLFGTGFGGFWVGASHGLWEKFTWLPTQAHNGYLDVYLQTGFVGFALLLISIYSAYRNIARDFYSDVSHAYLRLVFVTVICIHNLTESSFFRGSALLWLLFLLFAIAVPSRRIPLTTSTAARVYADGGQAAIKNNLSP